MAKFMNNPSYFRFPNFFLANNMAVGMNGAIWIDKWYLAKLIECDRNNRCGRWVSTRKEI